MRVKRGQAKNKRHNKVLKEAKGYRMSYSKLYRRAMEAVRHAGNYNFYHRKRRHSQKRNEWIKTISAALSGTNVSYSQFIGSLKKKNIELDRKVMAQMAMENPKHFEALVTQVSK